MEADERERRAQVAADARQSGQEILRELDAVVAPSDWSPEAMHARLAVLRQLRASAGVPAALEWNESRTVSRWAAEPSLAALVFDQVEDWLRRAASAGG
jgi:hypothetical protein